MSKLLSHSPGNPLISAAVVGTFSLALALVLQILGIYRGVGETLWNAYQTRGFRVGEGFVEEAGGLWVVAVLVYSQAWLLCEVPGLHRRLLVLLSSLVLIALASLVLALWGLYWCPAAALVATLWAGFCAILWANQHRMPCEGAALEGAPGKIISMEEGKNGKARRKHS